MRLTILAAAILSAAAVSAQAEPATYTLSGTFTGTIGALSFTSDPGTITLNADTSGTDSLGAGFYTNTDGISTINLGGIGTAIFLDPTFGVESETDGVGFYDTSNSFGVSLYDPALGDYDLSVPFTDTAYLLTSSAASSGTTELTSLGQLSITGDLGSSTTFTASAVPEPTLTGAAMIGLADLFRRRRASR